MTLQGLHPSSPALWFRDLDHNEEAVPTYRLIRLLVLTEDPPHSSHKACDKCGDQASDTTV